MAAVFYWVTVIGRKLPVRNFHLLELVAFRYIGATKPKQLEEVSSGVFAGTSGCV